MKKFATLSLVFLLLITGIASAELGFGFQVPVNFSGIPTYDDILASYQNASDLFYAPFVEIGGKFTVFGASYGWRYRTDSVLGNLKDTDVYGYFQGHLFGYRAFLDPFIEIGCGYIKSDFAIASQDNDTSNPITASIYFSGSGGLGIILTNIGIFARASYLLPA
ncbi:MAG: hypothetical protein N3A02_08690 [Rectinema sp.]|nr:hypothetical protein [Rectinema sp.]